MGRYMTKQRKLLLEYFSHHGHEALSAGEIAEELAGEGISVSAVYRNLSALEEEGHLKRSSRPGSREAFYQYTDLPECREQLHLSCTRCGKTFHMDSAGTERLLRSIAEKEDFSVDQSETVLYGVCGACRKV